MVLRDERDKMTSKRILCRGKTRADAKWARRKSKTHRRKSRINTKKNIDIPVVFTGKKESVIQEEKVEKKEVCSICYESTKNLKYINCKRGGVQNVNFGKYGECCKDKPICGGCRSKCSKCPFCKEHSLRPLKNRFPQKKPTFAVKQERIRLKKAAKEKKRRAMLRVSVRRSPNFDYYATALAMMYAPTVYTMDRTPLIMRDRRTRSRRGRGFRED
tara:strand:+ start:1437 stop:2084 length:648 start_codon:yes stop_codon:yes gene_type:complete